MFHPEFTKVLAADHLETLRRDARVVRGMTERPTSDTREVQIRLCRTADDPQLEQLALLEGRPLPFGRLVVAVVDGRIVAAKPLGGGFTLRDPFVQTEQLVKLLDVRAEQLREPRRRSFLPRYVSLIRGSTHA
jgi:hypothetical protein